MLQNYIFIIISFTFTAAENDGEVYDTSACIFHVTIIRTVTRFH